MDIAIVILNWNGRSLLERHIPVLKQNTPRDKAFIVVADNGSTDDSCRWLQENHPDVECLPFDRNYGFAAGYNRALREIDADYYILLNSDVEVTPGWLDPLVAFMEDNPDVGICQPKVLSWTRREYFEYAGAAGGFIDSYGFPFCRGRILSNLEKDCGQYDEPMQCFWASGACMMVRSALYHHLGGLDENFFAHMEEIDFCWRAKLAGHQVWAVPESVVYHEGGASLNMGNPRKLYLNYRNNLLMLYKNLPTGSCKAIMRRRRFMDFGASLVYLLTGRVQSAKAVWRAYRDFRNMRDALDIDQSAFSEDGNDVGRYEGSIIWQYVKSFGKATFEKVW